MKHICISALNLKCIVFDLSVCSWKNTVSLFIPISLLMPAPEVCHDQ